VIAGRPLDLPEVRLFQPAVHRDARGGFRETWRDDAYPAAGAAGPFVLDAVSTSSGRVLRGLHFQHPRGQSKLVTVVQGAVFDVVVDVRRGAPSFGRWIGIELSEDNCHELWIPAGFAHGFVVLSERAVMTYKCTDYHSPACEHVIRWDDPALAIRWPVTSPVVSARDAAAPCLADFAPENLPVFADATA
jgi:dTDP-4-dehydrorhamnose 3,5-epimerase